MSKVKAPQRCERPGPDRKESSDMTDSTQQARAASIPDAAIEAAASRELTELARVISASYGWEREDISVSEWCNCLETAADILAAGFRKEAPRG